MLITNLIFTILSFCILGYFLCKTIKKPKQQTFLHAEFIKPEDIGFTFTTMITVTCTDQDVKGFYAMNIAIFESMRKGNLKNENDYKATMEFGNSTFLFSDLIDGHMVFENIKKTLDIKTKANMLQFDNMTVTIKDVEP